MTLFIPEPYQQKAIDFAVERQNAGLLIDTGLGKTGMGLSILTEWYDAVEITQTLVLAPPLVAEHTWTNEIKKFHSSFGWMDPVKIIGTPKQREKAMLEPSLLHLCSYNNFRWLLKEWGDDWPWDCIVFDELSRMKNPSSKRFKAFRHRRKRIKKVLGLGGTPAPNGYGDLWAQSYCIDNGRALGSSVVRYRERYFYSDFLGYKYTLKDDAKEEIDAKLKTFCISMEKEDYLTLPPVIRNMVSIELPPKARKIYDELRTELGTKLDTGVEIETDHQGSVENKLRQICNGFIYDDEKTAHIIHDAKLQALESIVEEAAGEPVLVGYQFIPDKDAILKKFGKRARLVDDDSDLIRQWEDGEIEILIAYASAAAHGLNLQYGGHILVWYGNTWDYETHYQFESRLYRRGQTKPVRIHNIVVEGAEARVTKALNSKEDLNKALKEALKL